jgi:hypothetical protein
VCSPIDEGGLGIRNMRRFNQALLGKWFGSLLMRRELGGDRFWWLSMGWFGGRGVGAWESFLARKG